MNMSLKFSFVIRSVLLICCLLPIDANSTQTNTHLQCFSGNPKNLQLHHQLQEAVNSSSIAANISLKYGLHSKKTESQAIESCKECLTSQTNTFKQGQSQNLQHLQDIAPAQHSTQPKLESTTLQFSSSIYKSECVQIASQIKASTTQIICPSGAKSSKFNSCISEDVINYQNAVISDFYRCIKAETNLPISPEALFNMYSNESAFKPHYSSPAGTGIGQLTSIFIDDIHQKHRGKITLNKIANSQKSDCDIVKTIASKDLKSKPNFNNKCNYIQYGEGFERNVLYSLVGMTTNWNKDILPLLTKYIDQHKSSPDLQKIKDLSLLNAYGAGGRAAARATVRQLIKLPPSEFAKKLTQPLITANGNNLTKYLTNIDQKQKKDLAPLFTKQNTIDFKNQGSKACIQN